MGYPFTYYGRTALSVFRAWRFGRVSPMATTQLPLRVRAVDLDYNGHMNNARYLEASEMGRIAYLTQSGVLSFLVANRRRRASTGACAAVLGSTQVRFIKELGYGTRYTVRTRLGAADDKYCFLRHEFVLDGSSSGAPRGAGDVACLVYAKTCFLGRREGEGGMRVVPPAEFVETLSSHLDLDGVTLADLPPLSDDPDLEHWVRAETSRPARR
jgi:acyl-CoA thioesterase FadM